MSLYLHQYASQSPYIQASRKSQNNWISLGVPYYLSSYIYLPISLNPRRGHETGSGESSAGVFFPFFFFFSFCAMLVVLVVSERRASAYLIMLSAKQGTIFNAFGMARPGIEPTTSRSRSRRSTICTIGTSILHT